MIDITRLPRTVLVVDDETVVTDVFARLLGGNGLEVHQAQTLEEGLEALRGRQFGCAIIDKNRRSPTACSWCARRGSFSRSARASS